MCNQFDNSLPCKAQLHESRPSLKMAQIFEDVAAELGSFFRCFGRSAMFGFEMLQCAFGKKDAYFVTRPIRPAVWAQGVWAQAGEEEASKAVWGGLGASSAAVGREEGATCLVPPTEASKEPTEAAWKKENWLEKGGQIWKNEVLVFKPEHLWMCQRSVWMFQCWLWHPGDFILEMNWFDWSLCWVEPKEKQRWTWEHHLNIPSSVAVRYWIVKKKKKKKLKLKNTNTP